MLDPADYHDLLIVNSSDFPATYLPEFLHVNFNMISTV